MAPRLFPRNPKRPPDAPTPPDADADSQLFSKDLAFGHAAAGETTPELATAPATPIVQPQDRQQPGWYPDTTDPGLMRYWDGFHFTGQAKRPTADDSMSGEAKQQVSVATSLTATSLAGTAPLTGTGPLTGTALTGDVPAVDSEVEITDVDAVVESLLGPSIGETPFVGAIAGLGPKPSQGTGSQIPAFTGPTEYVFVGPTQSPTPPESSVPESHVVAEGETTPMDAVYSGPDEKEGSENIETPVVKAADDDSVTTRDGHRGKEMTDSSHSEAVADGVSNWGKDAEQAVSRALTVDTPEAWEAAAHVAAVVSEMAQTMQSVADAKQTARQTAKDAEEAAEAERVATQTASDAKETAEKMAKAADDAAEAARVAARTAVEAKEAAELTAQAAPKAAEAASAASKTAADAKQKAEALEQVVASARVANTPTAWSEALKRAAVATETPQPVAEQPVAGATTEREPENAPSPALWKRSTPVGESVAEPIDQTLKLPGAIGAKDPSQQGVDILAELGPAPFLTPAPDGGSGSHNDPR